MSNHKIERLFYIIQYLSNHETATAAELAKHCYTSIRSIYRDMKVLEEMGYFYTYEGKKGYRLIHNPVQAPSNLTFDEWMALLLYPFLSEDSKVKEHPIFLKYRSALQKVSKKVNNNSTTISISSQIGERILFQDHCRESNRPEIMSTVIQAIAQNKSIRICYYSIHRNIDTERVIDPYYLVPRSGHLYIIAYCHFREEVRIFRLSRIREIEITENSFQIPGSFDIYELLADRWGIFAEEEEPIHFSVRFQKEVARFIYEYEFYAETKLLKLEDGSLLLETKVKGKKEFLQWIRSFGKYAEVLEPVEVRKELRDEYKSLVELYK